MAKFEITNPEALKIIEDFKSGLLLKPIIEKIKKIKWILISVCLLLLLYIFVGIGKGLYRRSEAPVFLPPNLESPGVTKTIEESSEYDSLREDIFNFSVDLPDPVMPDLSNQINFQKEEL